MTDSFSCAPFISERRSFYNAVTPIADVCLIVMLVGRGGGAGAEGGKVTFYTWLSTDVRAERPPFSALTGI